MTGNSSYKPDVCLSQNEIELGNLINAYRKEHKLKAIPISTALTKVAQAHVRDRAMNFVYDDKDRCNMHSWSDKGLWKKCCYTGNGGGECMWNKPAEIAGYEGEGYEIIMVYFNSEDEKEEVSAQYALDTWKESPHHNDVILNKNMWRTIDWNAMGVGIFQGYSAVWFGADKDSAGSPEACE